MIYERLERENQRTGITPASIIKYAPDHPDKPKLNTINLLSGKRLKTIYSDELEFLFTAYALRPDKKTRGSPPKTKDKKRQISKRDLQTMRQYRDLLNLLPGHIFKVYPDAPEGLNPYMVSRWLNENVKANPEHIKWVLESCKKAITKAFQE
jgi:hypothetical protein